MEIELKENVEFSGKVDRDEKIIHDVVFLSSSSKNTSRSGKPRKYSDAALTEAVSYFEKAPVFADDHAKEKKSRNFAGELRDVRREGDKNRGNLHVAESHSYLFDIAERFPSQIGLSIMATGKTRETATEEIVEGFVQGRRRSVDLVTDPATVTSLFENVQKGKTVELEEKIKELEEQVRLLKEENEKLKTEPKPLEERVLSLENQLIEQKKTNESLLEEKAIIEKKARVETLVQESKVERSDVFVAALMKCEKEDEMKALIEDRKKHMRVNIKSIGITEGRKAPEREKELEEKIANVLGRN
jgi:hypothetical protein